MINHDVSTSLTGILLIPCSNWLQRTRQRLGFGRWRPSWPRVPCWSPSNWDPPRRCRNPSAAPEASRKRQNLAPTPDESPAEFRSFVAWTEPTFDDFVLLNPHGCINNCICMKGVINQCIARKSVVGRIMPLMKCVCGYLFPMAICGSSTAQIALGKSVNHDGSFTGGTCHPLLELGIISCWRLCAAGNAA